MPTVTAVGRGVDLAAGGAEVDAALVVGVSEGVNGHGVAEDVDVTVLLREAVGQRLPIVAAGAAAEDLQLTVEGEVLGIAFDGDDVDGFGLVGVDIDQLSPASSERITSQCFCMKSVRGVAGFMAMW
jgi:hypothetical protein